METFTVKRIISGDTFVIKDKNIGKVKVQIAGITSALSANEECADHFRDVLTGLLPKGSEVKINLNDLDDQGNVISKVRSQGNIARKLIKQGYAQVNLASVEEISPAKLKKFEKLQRRAMNKKRGFWSDAFSDCRLGDASDELISSGASLDPTNQPSDFIAKPDSGIPGYTGSSELECASCSWSDIGFVPEQPNRLFGDQDINVETLFDMELVGPEMAKPITG